MKWAPSPSAYRNCIFRPSLRTERSFSPARKVLSMTFPSLARRSFVRTNAAPLPGFTCWNSSTLYTVPSTSTWLPLLSWFVLIDIGGPRIALVVELLLPEFGEHVGVVAEHEPRAGAIGQHLHAAVAAPPAGVIAQQPPERGGPIVVVAQVELVAGEKERPGVGQIEPQPLERRSVA